MSGQLRALCQRHGCHPPWYKSLSWLKMNRFFFLCWGKTLHGAAVTTEENSNWHQSVQDTRQTTTSQGWHEAVYAFTLPWSLSAAWMSGNTNSSLKQRVSHEIADPSAVRRWMLQKGHTHTHTRTNRRHYSNCEEFILSIAKKKHFL